MNEIYKDKDLFTFIWLNDNNIKNVIMHSGKKINIIFVKEIVTYMLFEEIEIKMLKNVWLFKLFVDFSLIKINQTFKLQRTWNYVIKFYISLSQAI